MPALISAGLMTCCAFDINAKKDRCEFAFVTVFGNRFCVGGFPPGWLRSHERDDRVFLVFAFDLPISAVQHYGAPAGPGFNLIEKDANRIVLAQGVGFMALGRKTIE